MSNTNKNGINKFKIANVTRISIMFVTNTIFYSKILVHVLFVTFIIDIAVKQQPLDSTRIRFLNANDSSFVIPNAI